MRGVMIIMATLCLLLGILPGLIVPWLFGIVKELSLLAAIPAGQSDWYSLNVNFDRIGLQLPVLRIVSVAGFLALAAFLFARRRPMKTVETVWNCGTPFQVQTMQYTGAALSELVRRFERESGPPLPKKQSDWPTAGSRPAHVVQSEAERSNRIILDDWFRMSRSKVHPQWVHEVFRAFYNRLDRWLYENSARFGYRVQSGDIRLYLRYILVTQVAVMVLFLILSPARQ